MNARRRAIVKRIEELQRRKHIVVTGITPPAAQPENARPEPTSQPAVPLVEDLGHARRPGMSRPIKVDTSMPEPRPVSRPPFAE